MRTSIGDLMTTRVHACGPETNLAAAGALMLDGDCGILPVMAGGRVTGVITDRDICVALATRDRRASELTVGEVAQSPVVTCSPDEDVHVALATMRRHRVRRLPVTARDGALAGIISMNDLIRATGPQEAVRSDETAETMRVICTHHLPGRPAATA